jgi:hypothetical protein
MVRHGAPLQLQVFFVFAMVSRLSPSDSCVVHGFLSLHITFTMHFDAQDLACLIVFGCATTQGATQPNSNSSLLLEANAQR